MMSPTGFPAFRWPFSAQTAAGRDVVISSDGICGAKAEKG